MRVVSTSIFAGMPTMEGMPKQEPAAMKTSRPPAKILGNIKGKVTSQSVRSGEAPEIRAASSRVGSIFSNALEIVIKAKGE